MEIPSKEEMYSALAERHGEERQKLFENARVAVCGLGGLGSNVAVHLVRAGVGHLHIMDFDRVDISNLNRQQYFPEQLGMYKSEALFETLKKIAPYCDIRHETVKLTEENIPELLSDSDIICEAFDKADQKAILVNTVLEKLRDKYLVAGSGMAGLGSANTIQTRRAGKRFYICGDGVSDVEECKTLYASRVAVCAAHEANMILRIISGETEA